MSNAVLMESILTSYILICLSFTDNLTEWKEIYNILYSHFCSTYTYRLANWQSIFFFLFARYASTFNLNTRLPGVSHSPSLYPRAYKTYTLCCQGCLPMYSYYGIHYLEHHSALKLTLDTLHRHRAPHLSLSDYLLQYIAKPVLSSFSLLRKLAL